MKSENICIFSIVLFHFLFLSAWNVGFLQLSQVCSAEESARQEAGLTDWLLVTRRCPLHPVAHSTSICWQMSWQRTPTLGITKNVPRLTFSIPKRRKNRIPLKISSFFQPPRNAKIISRSPQALVTAIDVLYEDWQVWVYIVFFWDWKFAQLMVWYVKVFGLID